MAQTGEDCGAVGRALVAWLCAGGAQSGLQVTCLPSPHTFIRKWKLLLYYIYSLFARDVPRRNLYATGGCALIGVVPVVCCQTRGSASARGGRAAQDFCAGDEDFDTHPFRAKGLWFVTA